MSGLHFDFTGNPSGLVNAANQSRIAIQGITDEADKAGMKIDEFLGASKNFVTSMTGIGIGVAGLQSFAKELVNVRSEFQDTEAKLKVFLKSEQAAADMMEELEDLAWNNTFEFTDITKAAAQLLAFKTDAKDVGDTINRLSEIAAGTGASLGDMVDRFNKVKATGKMDSNMVQSFSAMGVDVKSVLAELEGKSRSDYEGVTLTFQDLQKVIRHLTDEGGMFFGMMKERGKNLSDSIAGVRDNFALMMNDMGKSVQGPVKAGIDAANELIANWREVAKAIGGAVVAFGTYKAAFATIEGIKAARQKINYQLEAQELQSVTKATQEAYKVEIEMLEQQIQAGTAARDADLQVAVAKGNLTEAQAAEIASLRELAAQQVNELALKAQLAQADAAAAAEELKSLDTIESATKYYSDQIAAIEAKKAALGSEATAEQLSTLEKKKAIAAENLEMVSRQQNGLETRKQTVAQQAEVASKHAEGLAAQADAAQQGLDAVGKSVNTQQTKMLTRAQMALKMAMDATGLSMLANPYVLAALAVAALCFGIYKLVTAESAAEKAARKHNEVLEKRKQLTSTLSTSMNNSDGVISSSTTDRRTKQVEFDAMMNGTKQYKDDKGNDMSEEETANLREIEKRYAEHFGTLENMEAASDEERKTIRSKIEADFMMEQAEREKESAENYLKYLEVHNENLAKVGAQGGYFGPRDFKEAKEAIRLATEEVDKLKASYDKADAAAKAAAEAEANREKVDVEGTVQRIYEAERALELARQAFAQDASESNKQALKSAEEDLKIYTNNYQLQTGKQWKDTKKLNEDRQKAIRAAANEETRIRNSAIEDQRRNRKAELEQTIKELKQEEEEYRKANNGRSSGTLNQKIKNAKLQFDLDMKDLDRQWNEWKRNHERETIHLQMDIEMEALQRDLENATTAAERNAATAAIRTAEDNRMKSENREKADDEIKSKLGGSLESLEAYTQNKGKSDAELADILGIDAETVTQLRQIEEHYANILDLQMQQKAAARNQEDLSKNIDDMEDYVQRSIDIETERINAIADLRESEMDPEERRKLEEQVNASAAAKQQSLEKEKGYDEEGMQGQEALARQLSEFGVQIATSSFEQIQVVYKEFLDELDKQMKSLKDQNAAIDEYKNTQSMLESGTGENGEELTDEEKMALEERKLELEAQLLDYDIRLDEIDARRVQNAQTLQAISKGRKSMEEQYLAASSNVAKRESDQAVVSKVRWNASKQALSLVGNTARQVANTFGGYMSDKAKKALDTIATITDVAMSTIDTISSVVKSSSAAMAVSSAAAAESIKTVEKASVILAIIGAVIQAAMAIANLLGIESGYDKAKKKLDAQVEKVEELKDQQADLERMYKYSVGTKHYKDMAKAADNYSNVLREQQEAVRLAKEAESEAKDKDKKEARDNVREQERALKEMEDAQKELYQQLQDELLTTDLTSFTKNLADQYIEGFEQGMDGINGVLDSALNDMNKAMMKKGLQIALASLFEDTWNRIKTMANDGEVTTSEMDQIIAEMEAKSEQSKQIAEQYYRAMSERGLLGDDDVEKSSGGMSTMTQDQADTLSARFTALQIEGANVVTATQAMMTIMEQLGINDTIRTNTLTQMMQQFTLANEIALNQLDELRKITENTSTLADTNRRLRAIEDNTNSLRE